MLFCECGGLYLLNIDPTSGLPVHTCRVCTTTLHVPNGAVAKTVQPSNFSPENIQCFRFDDAMPRERGVCDTCACEVWKVIVDPIEMHTFMCSTERDIDVLPSYRVCDVCGEINEKR